MATNWNRISERKLIDIGFIVSSNKEFLELEDESGFILLESGDYLVLE